MIYKKIPLRVPYESAGLSGEGCNPELVCLCSDYSEEIENTKQQAIMICPGGGYDFLSDREAEPIAFAFLKSGIQCFVLRYSVYHKRFPTDLLEAAAGMAYIHEHADEYNIDRNKISICGFSAGGHLAASLAVHWNKEFVKQPLNLDNRHKPHSVVLCYPVISSTDTHQGSIDNLLYNNYDCDAEELISLEKQVSEDTPPCFIWHCADDGCVPVSNSLRFADALSRNKIPYALHIFTEGGHGLALADEVTAKYPEQINKDCQIWLELAVKWLKSH